MLQGSNHLKTNGKNKTVPRFSMRSTQVAQCVIPDCFACLALLFVLKSAANVQRLCCRMNPAEDLPMQIPSITNAAHSSRSLCDLGRLVNRSKSRKFSPVVSSSGNWQVFSHRQGGTRFWGGLRIFYPDVEKNLNARACVAKNSCSAT